MNTGPSLRQFVASILTCFAVALVGSAGAQPSASAKPVELGSRRLTIDRSVVRFTAPETGGLQNPRFISERMLAFEARLETLADPGSEDDAAAYRPRHIRRAMERHIAETLLSSLDIEPPVSAEKLAVQAVAARANLAQRVGGVARLRDAARAEGISDIELETLFQRQARASLYLDRMITPMLSPSEAELRVIHRTVRTPFMRERFDLIQGKLRRWYISQSLAEALRSFYEGARNRVVVTLLTD